MKNFYCRMTVARFESLRLIIIVVAGLLKIVLMPIYLQSYLNLAIQRLEIQKKEAGRITNVDLQKKVCLMTYVYIYLKLFNYILSENFIFCYKYLIKQIFLMLQIAAVYYYLCVVALQFVVPIIICLFFTFLYKTLGTKKYFKIYILL